MKNQEFPFVSIIVCTYNRGNRINPSLESLIHQTYPKDRYEIIVVDDGSTDGTQIQVQGVRVLRHAMNKGVSATRNTGIAAAKGEIIAYLDDDAVADPDWLKYLVEPFNLPKVAATGGRVFAYKTDRLAERYLYALGCGNPAPLAFGKSKNPLWRFWVYLKSMFVPIKMEDGIVEVQAVYAASVAYRASALKAVGNFDETLFYDEDSEISIRLRKTGARIMFVPRAIIYHRHRETIHQLMRQTYRNAENTLRYYTKEKKVVPIFPLPLFYMAIGFLLVRLQPIAGIFFLVFGPLLLYGWWAIRAFREYTFEYFIYGYIQLMVELAAIFGLMRAKFRQIVLSDKPA